MEVLRACSSKNRKVAERCDRNLVKGRMKNEFSKRACFEWSEVGKVYAFSDIHGDPRMLRRCLIQIGVIDATSLEWVGNNALVVICGDLIDDCRRNCANEPYKRPRSQEKRRMELGSVDGANEWEVLAFLNVLVAKGARIVWVMGNHELMRMQKEDGRYQRHVTRAYEQERTPRAWEKTGAMARLFGTPRCIVTVGDVVFLHADPVDVRGSKFFGPGGATKKYESAREYAEHVNGVVAKHGHAALESEESNKLLWGRELGHGYRRRKCDMLIPRHIGRKTFVVRGHCVTASSEGEARGLSIAPNHRGHASERAHFVDFDALVESKAKPGITFGCLEFSTKHRGIVSGVARVDCGASASIRQSDYMGVLEIERVAGGAITVAQIQFPAWSGGDLYTADS
jgi:hypothetical protein